MDIQNLYLIDGPTLRMDLLQQLSEKPPLFAPGDPLFWDDPHISSQMLAAHLDTKSDAASRAPETIERIVNWLVEYLHLQPGEAVLDLGCGPGLYASRLAARGLRLTGIDYSRRSIDYARQYAADHGLLIDYRYQDYLAFQVDTQFDAILLIYGDFCVLSDDKRDLLLDRVYEALKPGGRFVFDVTTRHLRQRSHLRNGWYAAETGFWKAGPHLVLERQFDYPDHDTYLEQYIVIDTTGKVSVYRNWFHDYTLETITPVVEQHRFTINAAWSDLTGRPYDPYSDWVGLVVQKD